MYEKLFTLCKLQLGSIVSDLEKSMDGVNASATRMMELGYEERCGEGEAAALAQGMSQELKNIIVGLQFHDELTQRLEHLQALLALLEEGRTDEAGEMAARSGDSEALVSRLCSIFSSNAEFKQLCKVFPGCQVAGTTDAIELF